MSSDAQLKLWPQLDHWSVRAMPSPPFSLTLADPGWIIVHLTLCLFYFSKTYIIFTVLDRTKWSDAANAFHHYWFASSDTIKCISVAGQKESETERERNREKERERKREGKEED